MSNENNERDFYFSFAYTDIFGVEKIENIKQYFGSLQNAWQAEKEAWNNFKKSTIEKYFSFKNSFSLEQTKKYLSENDIKFSLFIDQDYPENLKNISYPPPVIFYLGNLGITEQQKDFSLAIVGSRKTSPYGEKVLEDLINGLDNRFLIVSGLALGTDANAHRKALQRKIKTGAVLGGPIEKNHISCPISNYWLAKEILADGGFILSEFPPNTPIHKSNFPRRNRIIAGLCKGTLVIEAGEKSGALKTAEYAKDANRVVMAVPGSIYGELSIGTNNLLKDHVDLISDSGDIFNCLGLKTQKSIVSASDKQVEIIKNAKIAGGTAGEIIIKSLILLNKIANTDEISAISQLDTPCVHSTLTILELSGIIRRNRDGQFLLV
ncbi:MAG: DNA-processing protein DprA [Candidatus Falkowbacteria bacterium]|nr:DNA-processing protein DprA [Candidatus Falkowbacteria bacterium]